MSDAPKSKLQSIWQRTRVGGTLAAVLVLALVLLHETESPLLVWGIGVALLVGVVHEAARMGKLARHAPLVPLVAAALLTGSSGLRANSVQGDGASLNVAAITLGLAAVAGALAFTTALIARPADSAQHRPLLMAGLGAWLTPPLPLLALLYVTMGYGALLSTVVLSKVGDIAGYYGGNAFGKHHPFPKLSKGKTTEGCLASFAFALLVAAALAHFDVLPLSVGAGVIFGALINLASQAGDLLESALKRYAEVKDSGSTFGPSGGFLDVVDSLLLSVPTALLAWPLLA